MAHSSYSHMSASPEIILIDYCAEDRALSRVALERLGLGKRLVLVGTAGECLNLLEAAAVKGKSALPLVISEIRLPGTSGLEMLRQIRQSGLYSSAMVAFYTTSRRLEDMEQAYRLGANTYAWKPATIEGSARTMRSLLAFLRLAQATPALPLVTPASAPVPFASSLAQAVA
jgi:CheY-like chemotaxis protein